MKKDYGLNSPTCDNIMLGITPVLPLGDNSPYKKFKKLGKKKSTFKDYIVKLGLILPHKVVRVRVCVYIANACVMQIICVQRDTVRVHNQPTDESWHAKPASQRFWQGFQGLGSMYLS